MSIAKYTIISIVSVGIIAASIVTVGLLRSSSPGNTSLNATSLIDRNTLKRLTVADDSKFDRSHLASGVVAPTNKWFSGLALNKTPQPVFPMPLSFLAADSGFQIGLPKVTTTADTITGGHTAGIAAAVADASTYQVTRYDQASVDLTYRTVKGDTIGTLTLAAGSPYIFFEAKRPTSVTIQVANPQTDGDTIHASTNDSKYIMNVSGGASQTKTISTVTQTLPSGGLATYYALPNGQPDVLKQYAANKLTKTDVGYEVNEKEVTTTIRYETANDKNTVIATLPHHNTSQNSIDGYRTIYGDMQLLTGTNQLVFMAPRIKINQQLDISKLTSSQKAELSKQLSQDSQQMNFQSDSYGGGKAVYRAAQLLVLAQQLGDKQTALQIQQKLSLELSTWFSQNDARDTPRSFYYNNVVHGVVGSTPAFGSEEFNDHHFHYGYFIYAASILAQHDKEFVKKYGSMVNLLVADIANYKTDEELPLRRVFDPYASHSWASGSSPFADGNNQESSSEAINAWAAVELWAGVTHNQSLANEAVWLQSSEIASTKEYWLSAPAAPGYSRTIVSLNWGGKRDYSTFFSAAPAAKLAIQLIPLSPMQTYLQTDQVKAQLAEAVPDDNYNVPLGDYLLMYKGLIDPKSALQQAGTQSDQYIDSANSRTYLLAWLMTR